MTMLARSAVLEGFDTVTRDLGLSGANLLREVGLPAQALHEPDLHIPSAALAMLLARTAAASSIDDLGLRLAELRRPRTLGAVRLLMREQPDLRRAIAVLERFAWAQIEGLALALEDDGEVAILRLALDHSLAMSVREMSELAMASIVALLRSLVGQDWQPEMILLTHSRPAKLDRALRCFGQVPLFDQGMTALVMTSAELNRPIEGADASSAALVEQLLDRSGPGPNALAASRVMMLIREALPRGACRAELIARQMGIDRRTLHRRLAGEGTSFSRLLARVRLDLLAQIESGSRRSKTEIAGLMGFSDLSAYSRWRRTIG